MGCLPGMMASQTRRFGPCRPGPAMNGMHNFGGTIDVRRAAADNNGSDSSGSHSHQSRSRKYMGKAAKNWLEGLAVH